MASKESGRRVLGLITARGGSKGLPRKNILPLKGEPLIAWTIDAALRASCVTDCVVSSDDEEILEISLRYGALAPFVRPEHLAADTTSSMDVVFHAVEELRNIGKMYDTIILLQPTSPLRTSQDIDAAFDYFLSNGASCCVSICEPDHPPFWTYYLDSEYKLTPLLPQISENTRRQDLPHAYRVNGAIYIACINWLFKTKKFLTPETIGYIMPKERSVDIDCALDLRVAEFLLTKQP